jgi:hypothetical protein
MATARKACGTRELNFRCRKECGGPSATSCSRRQVSVAKFPLSYGKQSPCGILVRNKSSDNGSCSLVGKRGQPITAGDLSAPAGSEVSSLLATTGAFSRTPQTSLQSHRRLRPPLPPGLPKTQGTPQRPQVSQIARGPSIEGESFLDTLVSVRDSADLWGGLHD